MFEFPILAEKLDSISVKTFFLFYFFWRPLVFERKKRLNFKAFRGISSQISDKPCETDSRIMKIRVKVLCTFLTLSKDPLPFPNPGYAPDCTVVGDRTKTRMNDEYSFAMFLITFLGVKIKLRVRLDLVIV